MKRSLLTLFVLTAVTIIVVATFHLTKAPGTAQQRPHVIIITVDTLRADRLGCYGYAHARTPNIDRLAGRGSVFLNAVTPLPRTTPALATMLSGLRPHNHGSREVGTAVNNVPLLSEILQQHGYTTLAVSASRVAGPEYNLGRGFDQFIVKKNATAEHVTDQCLQVLDTTKQRQSVFVWLHYKDPHNPYKPPMPWTQDIDGEACDKLLHDVTTGRWEVGHAYSDYDGIAGRAVSSCSALYDAEIAFTDFHIGRLLDGLRSRLDFSNTIVIFTSDHGENLGEDGLFFEHGPSLHDASSRIPLIIAGPSVTANRDRSVTSLEDIMPFILNTIRIPEPAWPQMDGIDFSDRISGQSSDRNPTDRIVYLESASALLPHQFNFIHSGRVDGLFCLNDDVYSLCHDNNKPFTLHNHIADPFLKQDLAHVHPDVFAALTAHRQVWPPEEIRSRAVRTDRFMLIERPRIEGGYTRVLYDIPMETAIPQDVSETYPEHFDNLQRALTNWTATIDTTRKGKRSTQDLNNLRSLGYIR